MANGCGCGCDGETLVFTCAGAAYAGQVANKAGLDLGQDGTGKLFCLAAMGADVPAKMKRARTASRRIVIDGCEDHCGRLVMEKAGLAYDVHVVVTDLGIAKQPRQPHIVSDARKVADAVKESLTAE